MVQDTLFLVESGEQYGSDRLLFAAATFEGAVSIVERHVRQHEAEYDDVVRVRAVCHGPGPGVVVARWYSRRPSYTIWPCDGEGPPNGDPNTVWERVL